MAINGIGNTYTPGIRPQSPATQRPEPSVQRPAQQVTVAQPQAAKPSVAAPASGNALPVEAPKGTDPELWSVLTNEERQFFAKAGAMGPLTYGRIMTGNHAPPPPVARGGRLDVKV